MTYIIYGASALCDFVKGIYISDNCQTQDGESQVCTVWLLIAYCLLFGQDSPYLNCQNEGFRKTEYGDFP
jgi:hypothetical protein